MVPVAVTDAAQRRDDLVAFYHELSDCPKCPLAEGRNTVVFGTGDPDAEPDVRRRGARLQRGQAGKAVRRPGGQAARQAAGRDRDGPARTCFIANVLKCRPPGNRDPQPAEIEACEGHLFRQIELIQPRVVCSLGNFATKLLSGQPAGHHEGARRRRRCASSAGARSSCTRSSIPRRRSTRRRCWSGCARDFARAAGRCSRQPLPGRAGAAATSEPEPELAAVGAPSCRRRTSWASSEIRRAAPAPKVLSVALRAPPPRSRLPAMERAAPGDRIARGDRACGGGGRARCCAPVTSC